MKYFKYFYYLLFLALAQVFAIDGFLIGDVFKSRLLLPLYAQVIGQKGSGVEKDKGLRGNNVVKRNGSTHGTSPNSAAIATRSMKSTVSIEEIGSIDVDSLIRNNKPGKVETTEITAPVPLKVNHRNNNLTDMQGVRKMSAGVSQQLPKAVVEAFQAGRYKEVIELIKGRLENVNTDALERERLLRLAADCHFLLGDQDRQSLLTAVNQYKNILRLYPDPAEGNDIVYFRMASIYLKLDYYHSEAIASWERLALLYPNSTYSSEAPFRIGEILQKTEKYDRAIENFTAYLRKNPDGKFAKTSYYYIGDDYHRMGKSLLAGDWYDNARKRWPQFYDIPKATLKNMGAHYYKIGNYFDTFMILSVYASLYPDDSFTKEAIYKLASVAQETGQSALSLKIYSFIINKHPDIVETNNCKLEMANIGINNPGMRLPFFLPGVDSYLEPLKAYDNLLAQAADSNQASRILLLKAAAFWKLKRGKEAILMLVKLLSHFPDGLYSDESRGKLREYADSLIMKYYDDNDYLSVADIYFQSYATALIQMADYDIALKVGEALGKIGMNKEAGDMYVSFNPISKDLEKEALINLSAAKTAIQRGNYDAGENKLLALLDQGAIRNMTTVIAIKRSLADIYYYKKLYAKAASLYAEVIAGSKEDEGAMLYEHYAYSLLSLKMYEGAIKYYLEALTRYKQNPQKYDAYVVGEIYIGMGDAYYAEKKYIEGMKMYKQARQYFPDADGNRWLDYRIGQVYVGMEDMSASKNVFDELRKAGGGDFWPKVADFGLARSESLKNSKGN